MTALCYNLLNTLPVANLIQRGWLSINFMAKSSSLTTIITHVPYQQLKSAMVMEYHKVKYYAIDEICHEHDMVKAFTRPLV